MPGILLNRSNNPSTHNHQNNAGGSNNVQWIDQQQYLIETYREIRASLSQLENEIDAARLRVTDWTTHRAPPSSRPLRPARFTNSSHNNVPSANTGNAPAVVAASPGNTQTVTGVLTVDTAFRAPGPSATAAVLGQSRARSLSYASTASTYTESSIPSCCSHDSGSSAYTTTTGSSVGEMNAATLLTAFLMATSTAYCESCLNSPTRRSRTPDESSSMVARSARSASPLG